MSRKYTMKEPRFDPYKHIYIGINYIVKICTKCGEHKQLMYETYSKDTQREYGFSSHCRDCRRVPTKEYNKIRREAK